MCENRKYKCVDGQAATKINNKYINWSTVLSLSIL